MQGDGQDQHHANSEAATAHHGHGHAHQHGHGHSHQHGHGHSHQPQQQQQHGHGHSHSHGAAWDTVEAAMHYDSSETTHHMCANVVPAVLKRIEAVRNGKPCTLFDMGCGTGRTLTTLASSPLVASAKGEDLSEAMLSVAQKNIEALGQTDKVSVSLARPINSSRSPDEQYDVVTMCFVLHHILDQAERVATLRRLADMTSPGGILVLGEFEGSKGSAVHGYDGFGLEDFVELMRQVGGFDLSTGEILKRFEVLLRDKQMPCFVVCMKKLDA